MGGSFSRKDMARPVIIHKLKRTISGPEINMINSTVAMEIKREKPADDME